MQKKNTLNAIFFSFLLPITVILLLWVLQSKSIASPLIFPSPNLVFISLVELVQTSAFWKNILFTTGRTLYSFLLSLALSIILGCITGFSKKTEQFFSFPMSIIKTAPVVSFILLAIFWFSTNMVNVFIGVLMTLPVMTGAIAQGVKKIDKKLVDMANVYQFSQLQKIQHIIVPQVMPYFFSGCITAFALSWKVVVASEVLSLPKQGIGTALQMSKVHIETADVFAYTIATIILSFFFEKILTVVIYRKSKFTKAGTI